MVSSPPELERVEAVVYGTIALDRFLYEGTDREEVRAGGEAFNTAVALDGWGIKTLLVGTQLGLDDEGILLRHLLDDTQTGFPRRWEGTTPAPVTPSCTIRVARSGERSMNGRGFAQAMPPPPLPDTILSQRPIFICDPNLGNASVLQALSAHALGCAIVSMDFFDVRIIERSRLFITSPEALRRFAVPESSPESVVRDWCKQGAQTVVFTLGAAGGVVCDRDAGYFGFPACSVPNIVDTTGAGDTFRAGLVYGLLQNWTLPETLAFASSAAALHCTKRGAASRSQVADVLSL